MLVTDSLHNFTEPCLKNKMQKFTLPSFKRRMFFNQKTKRQSTNGGIMFCNQKLFGKRTRIATLVIGLTFSPAFLSGAFANELWVPPAKKDADEKVGIWAVAEKKTHFSFAVPNNMDAFGRAVVVLIPKKTTTMTYEVDISVADNADLHDAFTNSLSGLTAAVNEDEVTELRGETGGWNLFLNQEWRKACVSKNPMPSNEKRNGRLGWNNY